MEGQPSELHGGPGAERHAGMAATGLDRIEAELSGVERALTRLDDATYGTCEQCQIRLDDDVLAADPLAVRCPDHR
ncbi:hypothetical protein BH24ACT1_BH24ACT1_06670 [soil metagenome]